MTNQNNFVHLHVHTEFSLLDGFSRVKDLVKRAGELEMPAVAITDHGVMFGAMDFYDAAKGAGVKPIIGVEAYLAPRGMEDRDSKLDRTPFHLLLIARNQQGYHNLMKISSEAQIRGYYYRPRIDWDFLVAHSEGLIATSGCLAAKIPRYVQDGNDDEAKEWIGRFSEVFGEDNFYLELQEHDIDLQRQLNQWMIDYNRTNHTNVGLLATTDLHYVREEDYDIHDTLLCIQTGSLKHEKERLSFSDNSYYMYSYDQMMDIFGEIPDAVHNSLKIAEMCEVNLDRDEYHLPNFPVPEGFDSQTYLRYLCDLGMDWRFGERKHEKELQDRLDRELGIIHDMGFDTYFLIVWDLCEFARHADIWWNVRGSGAGSLAAYCLGITNIDPIKNALLFERFLNPGRVSMPDIDLDYPDDRRGEMIAYSANKYGEDKVAAIITFGTMGAKAAVRDVGRALDVPLPEVNRAAALIPQEAKQKSLDKYVEMIPDLKKIYDTEPQLKQIIDVANRLQGISRHASTHAAGVIIADRPLVEYLPLHRITGKDPSGGSLKAVTQFPMETCESIGLLKVDFLGLSTLTILRKACDLIEYYRGIQYTMDNIPYRHDEPSLTDEQKQMLDEAFELMGRGETVGVFQLESTGMQQMLRGMRPKVFENIVAGISLYRPGPMEFIVDYNRRLHGEDEPEYRHSSLESILGETYGIFVYQEQIMQVAGELFGYDLGEADLMRRAVSKKKEKELAKHRAIFLERGPANGIDEETAGKIFDDIEFFANYGFNKCLVGDTEIIDADTGRLVKIGDMAQGKATVSHTVTCDMETLKLQRGTITDVMYNGVKPVYRLRTRLGKEITATDNHPFYTFGGWQNLGDLQIGEHIAVPRRLPISGEEDCTFHAGIFPRFLWRDENAETDWLLKLRNDRVAYITASFWRYEASAWFTGELKETHDFQCTVNSRRAAQLLQHLLLRNEIVANIEKREDNHFDVSIVETQSQRNFVEKILKPNESLVSYALKGFDVTDAPYYAKVDIPALPEENLKAPDNDIYWDTVESIEYVGEEPTYDLTIDGTHNFIANDILVHNSHASDYAVITVQTAFLKTHYPEEFMTALLTVQRDDSAKVSTFLEECRRMNIPVLPPDVNYSTLDFDIQDDPETGKRSIRFGLAAIKNAGAGALQPIIDARDEGGQFNDLADFCKRIDLRQVGKRAVESLIKVGALHTFGERSTLYHGLERIMAYSADYHKDLEVGQMNMFGETMSIESDLLSNMPNMQEFSNREKLQWEKELLGLYVTGRPVDKFRTALSQTGTADVAQIKQDPASHNGREVSIAGEIVNVRKIYTKNNDAMAVAQIEDWHDSAGSIEVVIFPRTWDKVQGLIESGELHGFDVGEVVMIGGKFDISRGDPQIIADTVRKDFATMTTHQAPAYQEEESPPAWMDEPPPPREDIEPPEWLDDPEMYDEETGEVAEPPDAPTPTPDVAIPTTADGTVIPQTTGDLPAWAQGGEDIEIEPLENGQMDNAVHWLRVYFSRSGDDSQDRRRLSRLYNILVSFPGEDRFSIIVEGRNRADTLDFPNATTGFNERLIKELLEVVEDVNNIEVWTETGRVELTPSE